jgi:hypothetical protein
VTIPNSVTSIGNVAFSTCSSLRSITIPNSVTNISIRLFEQCTSLTNVNIPNSIITIGEGAFDACTNLATLNIPESVTTIGNYAFRSCYSLTNLTFPGSLTTIGDTAFSSCIHLSAVYFQGNAPTDRPNIFDESPTTVYYLPGTTGWGSTFGGAPTVLWNPTAQSLAFSANSFNFEITGPTNTPIVVEATTDLSIPNWSPISTNLLNAAGTSSFSDRQPNSKRFYRFRSP